ncbi:META domain [uncultured Bacteroides sp.]|uniref:META domain-containing protein n=1 Tax=Bacteroides cellulolyticus TaxID=2981780 RepID=UPI0008206B20|nr:META domain-containing protein [Bacteroides cellulolyticus]MCU6772528.1 META domain-containing protein [Bacteroides cellulolyticus]SCI43848.1 META domain [uncultured Bacteroides sp.]
MKKMLISAAAFAAVVLSSCGTTGKSVDISGEWNVVSVKGEQVAGNPYIGFNLAEGRIYGNAGCNRIMGGVEVDSVNPGKIGFTGVGATRMMCPDMETEQKVLEALNEVAGYQASSAGVELTDKDGNVLMSLEKKEAPAVSVNDINGKWNITKVEGAAVEVADKTPFISFNVAENAVHGNGGCNIINGSFSQEEGNPSSLKFGQMISTMMAGPGMETERKVLSAMNKVASFVVNEDGTLSLMDVADNEVLLLVKSEDGTVSE